MDDLKVPLWLRKAPKLLVDFPLEVLKPQSMTLGASSSCLGWNPWNGFNDGSCSPMNSKPTPLKWDESHNVILVCQDRHRGSHSPPVRHPQIRAGNITPIDIQSTINHHLSTICPFPKKWQLHHREAFFRIYQASVGVPFRAWILMISSVAPGILGKFLYKLNGLIAKSKGKKWCALFFP